MFITTADQDCLARALDQTGCLTTAQAHRLLRMSDPKAPVEYALRVLRQLQHMQRLRFQTDAIVALPHLAGKPADGDMLAAVDIMLDLAGDGLHGLSARTPPFKLCFLTGPADSVVSYGVVTTPPGQERQVNFLLEGMAADKRAVIFLLREPQQQTLFKTTLSHYFAAFDGEKYRYFKSGD